MSKLLSQLYPITAGVQGTTGSGTQGNQGVQGIGAQGDQGVQGLSNQGVQGTTGDQGVQGTTGDQGVQGLSNQGVQGINGDQGVQGLSNQGVQGINGDQGVQGVFGTQGAQGILGNQGVQGLQGIKGDTGTSISIVGTLALTVGNEQSELNDTGTSWYPPTDGESVIDSNTGNLWVYNGSTSTWNNVGLVRGPQGTQGIQGISNQGVQGPVGDQGIQGLQSTIGSQGVQGIIGNQGVQGIIGTTFNYSVVSTSQTLVSNQGYIIDTGTYGAMTLTLPASPTPGQYINFQFTRGSSNNLTIARNGVNINGVAEDLVCDVSANFSLIYGTEASVGWRFVPNSGLTTPVIKIYKATWTTSLDNLNTGDRIPFTTQVVNTDSETFGSITNGGNKSTQYFTIKKTGYYNINANLHLYDLAGGMDLMVQLWKNEGGSDILQQAIVDFQSGESDTDQILTGNALLNVTVPNTQIWLAVTHNGATLSPQQFPFPSTISTTGGSESSTPPDIIITKLA